jgi:hypothetical protein
MQHHLGPFLSTPVLFTSPKENHIKPMNQKYAYNMIVGFKHPWIHEEDSWSPSISQPSTQNSWRQPIRGSHEVWTQADKGKTACLLLAEPILCPILLKKREAAASHPLQRDKSNYSTIFKLLKALQLILALHSTGNHDFWYCSRSRLLHNSSKITGSNQNSWGMKKYDERPMTMPIPVPKGLRE